MIYIPVKEEFRKSSLDTFHRATDGTQSVSFRKSEILICESVALSR